MIYIINLCPLLNDLHYLPMSPIIFAYRFILPPWIYFVPISYSPWKLLNVLHYLPMSHITPPSPDSFCPHLIPPRIILPPGNR